MTPGRDSNRKTPPEPVATTTVSATLISTENKRCKPRLRGEGAVAVVPPYPSTVSSRKWTVPELTDAERLGWTLGRPPESLVGEWLLVAQEALPQDNGQYATLHGLYAGEGCYLHTSTNSSGVSSSGFARDWKVVMWRICT
jgi:hypothetical protein